MKITFFSNFLNHHQIPICNAFYDKFKSDFTFVACEQVPDERIKLGYIHDFKSYPYLLESHSDPVQYEKALKLGFDSDIVIIGSADEIYIKERLIANKLTFRYSERLFKTNKHVVLYPYLILKRFKLDTIYRNKNMYMLCSSAFTPLDYTMFFSYPKRFFKWGYFPQKNIYDMDELMNMKQNNTVTEFLWVGRLIAWKRPFDAINVIKTLIADGFKVHLNIIGTGPLEVELKQYIEQNNLAPYITLVGSVEAHKVRSYMDQANIFLMTSNKQEGWGAVVNEAMNSGCAVYAYYKVGSAPYLIKHRVNGTLYKTIHLLTDQVKADLIDPNVISKMGVNAYHTITGTWNAEIAVNRFIDVASQILDHKKPTLPTEGPLSKAEIWTSRHVRKMIK